MIRAGSKEYSSCHHWLSYRYGKASKCESKNCTGVNPKRFEWALRKGFDYEKKRENYIMLCPSCHRKYDFTEIQRSRMSASKKGNPAKNKMSVSQYSLDNKFIAKHDSYVAAAESVNGENSAFNALKRGRLKTYKGYLWKFEN